MGCKNRYMHLSVLCKMGLTILFELTRDKWINFAKDVEGDGPDCYHLTTELEFPDKDLFENIIYWDNHILKMHFVDGQK